MKRDLFFTLAGNTILQLCAVISSIIISIFYKPEDLGKYSIVLLISSILATFYTLRSETLILIERDEEKRESTYHFAQNLSIILFILTLLLCVVFVTLRNEYIYYLYLPFLSFITANQLIERETYFKDSKFKEEAILSGTRGVINNILQIVIKNVPNALIISKILAESSYIIRSNITNKFNFNFSIKETYQYFSENKQVILNLTANRILQNISNNGFFYITSIFFGLSQLGIITLATKVIQLPANLLGEGLSKLYEKYQQDRNVDELKLFRAKFYFSILAISITTSAVIAIISFYDFFNLLPSRWNEVGTIALLLSPLTISNISNAFILSCYKIANKVTKFNKIELLEGLTKIIILVYLGFKKDLSLYVQSYVLISVIFHFIKVGIFKMRYENEVF